MTDAATVLSVVNVEKSYGRVKALNGVSLSVREGEFVALLGPNGAGKSTLLQLLTGLFNPDSGQIKILGVDLRANPVRALANIGVVFQQPTVDLELTVRRNLYFHTDLHGISRAVARKRIDEALQRFGLMDREGDRARTLSGGNRRRLELARSLLHEPKILLMDEATVGLDPASRASILDDILRLRTERRLGVLWTTHLVDEVENADRVIVLHRGKVLFDGTGPQLVERQQAWSIEDAFLKMTGTQPTGEVAGEAA